MKIFFIAALLGTTSLLPAALPIITDRISDTSEFAVESTFSCIHSITGSALVKNGLKMAKLSAGTGMIIAGTALASIWVKELYKSYKRPQNLQESREITPLQGFLTLGLPGILVCWLCAYGILAL